MKMIRPIRNNFTIKHEIKDKERNNHIRTDEQEKQKNKNRKVRNNKYPKP